MPATPPVTTAADLSAALARLAPGDFVALDTEFMRESTYFPKLCLIQAATSDACAVLDPLAVPDLDSLWQFLGSRERTKVLHAARQDLEVLTTATPGQPVPGPIFDTQIAAALLGHPAQIGYGSLVAERLGHTLAKGHTRTDWTRRPLSPEQLQYAEDDVRYLVPLYLDLRKALEAAGRLDWLYEDARARTARPASDRSGCGVAQAEGTRSPAAATTRDCEVTRAVARSRGDQARQTARLDSRRRRVARDCGATARHASRSRIDPRSAARCGAPTRRGVAGSDRARPQRGSQRAAASYPPRPQPQQLALVTKLMNIARETAQHAKINAEVLATRRDIEQLVFARRTEHLLSGWRREIIGEPLLAAARQSGLEL